MHYKVSGKVVIRRTPGTKVECSYYISSQLNPTKVFFVRSKVYS